MDRIDEEVAYLLGWRPPFSDEQLRKMEEIRREGYRRFHEIDLAAPHLEADEAVVVDCGGRAG